MSRYGYGSVGGPDDIVGGAPYDIVGAQLQSIIGSMSPSDKAALAASLQQARQIDPHAAGVVPRTRDKRRRLIMGPDPVVVATGDSEDVALQPQQLFRTERLIIPSEIAPFFRIDDIRVGNRSQLVTTGALPASAFSEVAIDAYVEFDTADIGNIITLTVTNTDDEDQTFLCMLLGTAAI